MQDTVQQVESSRILRDSFTALLM